MKLVMRVKRPLDRLVTEGVLISEYREGALMNRRGEWGQHLPPKSGLLGVEEAHKGLKRKKDNEDPKDP